MSAALVWLAEVLLLEWMLVLLLAALLALVAVAVRVRDGEREVCAHSSRRIRAQQQRRLASTHIASQFVLCCKRVQVRE